MFLNCNQCCSGSLLPLGARSCPWLCSVLEEAVSREGGQGKPTGGTGRLEEHLNGLGSTGPALGHCCHPGAWGTPLPSARRCALCPGRCLSCAVVQVLQNKVILQVSFHLLVWKTKTQHLLHSFCVSVLEFKILDHLRRDNTRKHQPVTIAAFCLFCQESNVQEAGATTVAVQRWWSRSWQSWRFLRRKELQASQMPLGKAGKAPLPFRSRQFYSHFSNNSHVRFLFILVSLRKDKLPSSTICSGAGSIILLCSLYCIFLEQIN